MVVRVQGGPQEGLWFSADVVFATLTVTGATFATDIAGGDDAGTPPIGDEVNSSLEIAVEAVNTRGTVIGLRVTSETVIQLIIDYGQAFSAVANEPLGGGTLTQALVWDEVEAIIDSDGALSGSIFSAVGTDFTAG